MRYIGSPYSVASIIAFSSYVPNPPLGTVPRYRFFAHRSASPTVTLPPLATRSVNRCIIRSVYATESSIPYPYPVFPIHHAPRPANACAKSSGCTPPACASCTLKPEWQPIE